METMQAIGMVTSQYLKTASANVVQKYFLIFFCFNFHK